MSRRLLWVGLLLLSAMSGCDSQPFDVVAPSFRDETGTALVSVQVPVFFRGLIHRVRVQVTSADTGRIRTIQRDMNFPIPGGNLAVGQIAGIPPGKRRFTVTAFDTADTKGVPRFRGHTDSTVIAGQTKLVRVRLSRVGGRVNFDAVLDTAEAAVDSATLVALPLSSVLDILELVPAPAHSNLAMLPLASVSLGDRFTVFGEGQFSRRVTITQIPTGRRRFVAHLKDLSSAGTRAFVDTVVVDVDTLAAKRAIFNLLPARPEDLAEIFTQPTLPPDSTVIILTPQF